LLPAGKFGGEHPRRPNRASFEMNCLENHRKTVAAPKIAVKIDLPAEDISELDRDSIGNPRSVSCCKKRGPDLARFHLDTACQLDLLLEGLEAFAETVEPEHRIPVGEIRERPELAGIIDLGPKGRAGHPKAERQHRSLRMEDKLRVPLVGAEPAEQRGRRLVQLRHAFLEVHARAGLADVRRRYCKGLDDSL